ncbi:hypothetical protein RB11731 [Rhodopirellula baltica SH 1]|uniref:Uncharacterized protein n=1 Tax=Rhodopirellula baltica (strain DSM 10527 / NCIMB 13988 / SH1) TaxID=243090 RepID=Q7UDW8_RHOBA|nr:hypothetical protein RB11731 [Rhodopirellula baltica SH 1]
MRRSVENERCEGVRFPRGKLTEKHFFRFWPKLLQTQPNSRSQDVLCLHRDELLAH